MYFFFRSRSDSQGREFIILNGKVQSDIQDDRKGFVFSLQCTGVQEIYFSVDEEDTYCDWLSKLEAACASGTYIVWYFAKKRLRVAREGSGQVREAPLAKPRKVGIIYYFA